MLQILVRDGGPINLRAKSYARVGQWVCDLQIRGDAARSKNSQVPGSGYLKIIY